MKKQWFILLMGTALAINACNPQYSSQDEGSQPPYRKVKTSQPELSTSPIPVVGSGLLASATELRLSFKTGGIISELHATEGKTVRKGEVLARLDLSEINAMVAQAREQVEKYRRDLDRVKNLYRDSVATLEQVQDLRTALALARAQYEVATFNQQHSVIKAPADGRILKRYAEAGELTSPGAPIVYMAQSGGSSFVLRIAVADKDVVRLQNGDSASLSFDAWPGETFSGRVSEIAGAADPATGTFAIELQLDPQERMLKNGFIGKAVIFPAAQEPYYKVPMDALVDGEADKARVFELSADKKVYKKTLRPQYIAQDYFTVPATANLQKPLVTEGAAYLSEGETVTVLNP